jgi:hypothetical protein
LKLTSERQERTLKRKIKVVASFVSMAQSSAASSLRGKWILLRLFTSLEAEGAITEDEKESARLL